MRVGVDVVLARNRRQRCFGCQRSFNHRTPGRRRVTLLWPAAVLRGTSALVFVPMNPFADSDLRCADALNPYAWQRSGKDDPCQTLSGPKPKRVWPCLPGSKADKTARRGQPTGNPAMECDRATRLSSHKPTTGWKQLQLQLHQHTALAPGALTNFTSRFVLGFLDQHAEQFEGLCLT